MKANFAGKLVFLASFLLSIFANFEASAKDKTEEKATKVESAEIKSEVKGEIKGEITDENFRCERNRKASLSDFKDKIIINCDLNRPFSASITGALVDGDVFMFCCHKNTGTRLDPEAIRCEKNRRQNLADFKENLLENCDLKKPYSTSLNNSATEGDSYLYCCHTKNKK